MKIVWGADTGPSKQPAGSASISVWGQCLPRLLLRWTPSISSDSAEWLASCYPLEDLDGVPDFQLQASHPWPLWTLGESISRWKLILFCLPRSLSLCAYLSRSLILCKFKIGNGNSKQGLGSAFDSSFLWCAAKVAADAGPVLMSLPPCHVGDLDSVLFCCHWPRLASAVL